MKYRLKGVSCPGCIAKIEDHLHQVKGLESAAVNPAEGTLELSPEMADIARTVISRVEPGAEIEEAEGALDEDLEDEEESKWTLPVIAASAMLLVSGLIFRARLQATPHRWAEYAVFLAPYLAVGWPVLLKALRNLGRGQLFDENFLMTIATFGALAIGELPEATAVMVFYSLGEYLQDRSVDRSRRTIKALLRINPDYANLETGDGVQEVAPSEVGVGQTVVVKPGEKVPLDGEVLEGISFLDASALTGEPVPLEVSPGKTVLAGMINGQGLLRVRVTKPFSESSVSRILDLVENASSRKSRTEQFMTTFAKYYTPFVVFGALGLAIVPPLVLPGQSFSTWVYRALIMLVISCPCALVISIPLGYMGGIGASARHGILVKGANYLDALADLHTVVFDKTGTLTLGTFEVTDVVPCEGFDRDSVLSLASSVESYSTHPIAQSIQRAFPKAREALEVVDYRETPGRGVSARVNGLSVLAGSAAFLRDSGVPVEIQSESGSGSGGGTEVFVALDSRLAGKIVISDQVKPEARPSLVELKKLGVRETVMLTGDAEATAKAVAAAAGIDRYYAGLLPDEKVATLEVVRADVSKASKDKVAFVGDGINDAPVIARADVGMAMGAMGSDAAIEAADVVLMDGSLRKVPTAVRIAKRTRAIVRQNVGFALGIKALFLALGAWGSASIWEAVFADVGVALLAVVNAMRTLALSE